MTFTATTDVTHEHDWHLNFWWNGGPSDYPIAQCVTCNLTDVDADREEADQAHARLCGEVELLHARIRAYFSGPPESWDTIASDLDALLS